MTPEEVEARFERIERALDFLATNQAQFREDVTRLERQVEQVSRDVNKVSGDVAKLVDVVASLARLFERHVSDGHGGKE